MCVVKRKYVETMQQHMQYSNLAMHVPFVGLTEDVTALRQQLLGFREMHTTPRTPFAAPRSTFSGKASGKDDRVMALLMGTRTDALCLLTPCVPQVSIIRCCFSSAIQSVATSE